ncbi:MAG: acyl-CoA dehydrogenase family protein [Actinomycetota bacterium]|nr:acyl-CoA dehydrogenase family protein [Actinomycetota bacterium]
MDLTASRPWWPLGDMDQMRDALRYWIAHNWDTSITVAEWWDRLASSGLAVPTWNRSHGGLAATAQVQQVIEQELAAAGTIAPPLAGAGVRLVGPILRQFASAEQALEVLPPLLTGRHLWTVLLTEPGSDDPADTACAAAVDWKYITVSGVKTCTDDGATHAVLLARTADLPGRKGLSCTLLDLADPGITKEPGLVRLEGVKVNESQLLGPRDGGWAVVKTILPYLERSLAGRIRRGLVNIEPGVAAGNLDRTVGDVLAAHRATPPPQVDRRQR